MGMTLSMSARSIPFPLIPVKIEMLHKIENIHAMERTKLYV